MDRPHPLYPQRRVLRAAEGAWARVEGLVNRLGAAGERLHPYTPLYHLGTLSIFLLVVLTVTGLYLTLFYRPGTERAYETVTAISASPVGSMMRGIHRYASDALIVVLLLHAWKMLVGERFWGSRWVSWVTGWLMLPLFWVIGSMGYWLVWDEAAQWLTESLMGVLGGSFALSFLGADVAARTFALFVIVLFLHVFLPVLVVLGILLHVMRLTRARIWAPRWLVVQSIVLLGAAALLWPARSGAPADPGRLLASVRLDWLYLGFLPLASRWGALFWAGAILLLAVITALPWLARGRDNGPAVIINPHCSGCALCARECPYEAIEMITRTDGLHYERVAQINENLCTGCGICVGTCSTSGVELAGFHAGVVREDLRRTLREYEGERPVVLFTCERHAVLGTLPALEPSRREGTSIPLLQARLAPRAQHGIWRGELPVLTYNVPCIGMLNPWWFRDVLGDETRGIVVASCPSDDCSFREGPFWLRNRIARRRSLRDMIRYVELAPGERGMLEGALARLGEESKEQAPPPRAWHGLPLTPRAYIPGAVVLLLVLLFSLVPFRPATRPLPEEALLRVAFRHAGELLSAAENLPPEILEKLPPNVPPEQVLGGERFPVHLRLEVDGEVVLEREYEARGLRREGGVEGIYLHWLPPGEHHIRLWMMDDGQNWEPLFDDRVELAAGDARTLLLNSSATRFELQGAP